MKKYAKLIESLRGISNALDEEGKARLSEVISALNELAANADDEGKAEILAELDKVKADLAKSNEEVAEKVRILRNELAAMTASNKKNMLTKELAESVAKAVFNSRGRDEVRRNVESVLKENGVSGLEYAQIIDYSLELKVEDANPLVKQFHETHFSKFHYGEIDLTNAAQIAKGWDKTSTSDKAIQELEVNVKSLNTAYIYKRQQFANEDLDEIEEAGQLSQFLAVIRKELRQMVEIAIMTAVLVGDKVNTGKDRVTTFETIGTKTASDAFTTVLKDTDSVVSDYLTAVGATTAPSILLASARLTAERLYNPNSKHTVMVMNKSVLSHLAGYKYAAGGDVSFRSKEEIAAQIGVDEIITTDIMPVQGNSSAPLFVALIPDGYWVKKRKTIDVAYPTYEKNVQSLQYEENVGGAIHDLLSTAVFVSTAKASA